MRGFTDKALILLSKPDSFEECGSIYKYDYKVAIDNIARLPYHGWSCDKYEHAQSAVVGNWGA